MASDLDLVYLQEMFDQADAASDISLCFEFKKELMELSTPEVIDFHFELLKCTKYHQLRNILAIAFEERGECAEKYLLKRVACEQDPQILAAGLQILGSMRSRDALPLIRSNLSHFNPIVRERACMAIGWLGTIDDLPTLASIQVKDSDKSTRKWAATQQLQILFRHSEGKDEVLNNLNDALGVEAEPEVIEMIVYSAGKLLGRNFGLKEDRNTGRMVGDLEGAYQKAKVELSNYGKKFK